VARRNHPAQDMDSSNWEGHMRLAEFILRNLDSVVRNWETCAAQQLPAAADMDSLTLRDHVVEMVRAIAKDLESYQSRAAQLEKSLGRKPAVANAPETAAQTHAILRAKSGFNINQLAAEYRALRASVLRLWMDAHPAVDGQADQIMRFNEAIDQALAESIENFDLQIKQARKLLLGVLGHDLRSPLHTIQMTAQHLTQLNAGGEVSEAAGRLVRSAARMHALLDDLHDYNRAKFGIGVEIKPTPLDAALAISDELDLLRAAHPARQIDLDVTGETRGTWDGMRLRQVLTNLIENAIKYGRKDATIEVLMTGDGAQLVLEVRNQGLGIDRSELKIIFDPLRRSLMHSGGADSANSLGLGLYIARQIVEGHGGDITARSDRGTTIFTVRLPQRLPPKKLGPQEQSTDSMPEDQSPGGPSASAFR
jgi:signal transduction histidine kinase